MSTETNRLLDRLLMLLGPLGAVTVALWYVGVYKGQTDTRLAAHDASLASLSSIVSTDHDVLIEIRTTTAEMHDWLKAKTTANREAGK